MYLTIIYIGDGGCKTENCDNVSLNWLLHDIYHNAKSPEHHIFINPTVSLFILYLVLVNSNIYFATHKSRQGDNNIYTYETTWYANIY